MPELPEIETIKNDLAVKLLNKKIVQIKVNLPKIVKNPLAGFLKKLINESFKKVNRRGKLMIFEINKDLFLLIHLRMTGQLIYQEKGVVIAGGHSDTKLDFSLPGKHTHLYFTFADKSQLFFNDLRQFGYAKLVDKKELDQTLLRFGVEPLSADFTLQKLKDLLKNKKRNIKAFLLDQQVIAGIGNIYADEILFASKVFPLRRTETLNAKEIADIHTNTKKILQKAIKYRGTTFNNYVDSEGKKGSFLNFLQVYQRANKPCLKCKSIIKKIKVAGRGTSLCQKCQK
ncbi:bifunctional DNA-formamidopyrimidine glycosylase/DNA-(apurinic or apyrimidinic site) lyase [Candidatus Gracilibacteria bacterium]|nr:bifunctional DNA-formamidopyrimidine glycosylase/DNA-(apurinic or apyrimidinic site) lyase [Candidatus Gracilibacteria bacterium]